MIKTLKIILTSTVLAITGCGSSDSGNSNQNLNLEDISQSHLNSTTPEGTWLFSIKEKNNFKSDLSIYTESVTTKELLVITVNNGTYQYESCTLPELSLMNDSGSSEISKTSSESFSYTSDTSSGTGSREKGVEVSINNNLNLFGSAYYNEVLTDSETKMIYTSENKDFEFTGTKISDSTSIIGAPELNIDISIDSNSVNYKESELDIACLKTSNFISSDTSKPKR